MSTITVERHADEWWVLYAGTVLFIGDRAECVARAKACAKTWRVDVSIEKRRAEIVTDSAVPQMMN